MINPVEGMQNSFFNLNHIQNIARVFTIEAHLI